MDSRITELVEEANGLTQRMYVIIDLQLLNVDSSSWNNITTSLVVHNLNIPHYKF